MTTALRRVPPYAFAFCLLILAVLSWLPGDELPRTGLAGKLEHFVAYAGTMLVGGLTPYAAIMELGQLVAPGRHAWVWDFLAGTAGFVTTAILLRLFMARPA